MVHIGYLRLKPTVNERRNIPQRNMHVRQEEESTFPTICILFLSDQRQRYGGVGKMADFLVIQRRIRVPTLSCMKQ